MSKIDPMELAQALIRCPSVTPADAGALDVLQAALEGAGFACTRLPFEAPGTARVDNLFARIGSGAPHFCFAGHTDVVPPGDAALWRHDPFAAAIVDGTLYGRGAADMKSAVAAFASAAAAHAAKGALKGSISLLITGDEEGVSINGTKPMLEWLKARGAVPNHCLVGEPTATAEAGDTIKIGRRGSMRITFTAKGIQGHTAYPEKARNPIPALAALVTRLAALRLDEGTAHFQPSTLVFTTFDVGNPASNVSPAEARASCNIRFNDSHTPESLAALMKEHAEAASGESGIEIAVDTLVGGVAFLTQPGAFTELLRAAIARASNVTPEYSTSGGTSDARFIKDYCPVAEIGLPGSSMHKVDECMPVAEILRLTAIYAAILAAYFAAPP